MVKAQTEAEEFSYGGVIIVLITADQLLCLYDRMKATMDRYKKGWSRPDLFSYFVQEDGQLQPGMTMKDLDADVRAAIMAGNSSSFYDISRDTN